MLCVRTACSQIVVNLFTSLQQTYHKFVGSAEYRLTLSSNTLLTSERLHKIKTLLATTSCSLGISLLQTQYLGKM